MGEQILAENRGDAGGAGDQVDGQAGHRVPQRPPCFGGQCAGPGAARRGCLARAGRLTGVAGVRGRLPDGVGGACLGCGCGQVDHLVDNRRVQGAGDDRDGLGVARGRLGVLAAQVAVFAEPGADPRVFQALRAGHLP
jgi:hypothetical protein